MLVPGVFTVCRSLDAESPICAIVAGGGPRFAAARIQEGVRDIRSALSRGEKDRCHPRRLRHLIGACDLALAQLAQLWAMGYCAEHYETDIFWPGSPSESVRALPRILASQLCANLFVIRQLAVDGFDPQARTIFRVFVELADLLTAVTADHAIASAYARLTSDGAKSGWEAFKPGRIRGVLSAVDRELSASVGLDWTAEFAAWRESTYTWLSGFSHANFPTQFVCTMWFENRATRRPGSRASTALERSMSYTTLVRAARYALVSILTVEKLLRDHHRWAEPTQVSAPERAWFDEGRRWFFYSNKVFSAYAMKCLEQVEFNTTKRGSPTAVAGDAP